jgi:PAS domain S-box-containing protein
MTQQSESIERVQFWLSLSPVQYFTIALFFHFAVAITNSLKKKVFQFSVVLNYLLASTFCLLDILFIDTIPVKNFWGWSNTISTNPLLGITALWTILLSFSTVIIIFKHYHKTPAGVIKLQLKQILFGACALIFFEIISNHFFSIWFLMVPDLSVIAFSTIATFVNFTIRRKQLFNLNISDAAEAIIKTMSDALIVVNTEQKIEIVNKALLDMTGYTSEELINNSPDQFIDDNSADIMKSGIISDVKTTVKRKNGTTNPVSLSWSVLRDNCRNVQGIVFIARDMSERERTLIELKNAREELENRVNERTSELEEKNNLLKDEIQDRIMIEEELAAQKEQLDVTLRSIGDGVITIDKDQTIIFVNKAAESITGWFQSDVQGKKFSDVYHLSTIASSENSIPGSNREDNEIINRRSEITSKSGAKLTLYICKAPILDKSDKIIGYVLVFSDITNKEIVEEELFKIRKLESISQLASGLAHDFNNILTGIITNLFMAKMGLQHKSDTYEMITNAEKGALRASSLTKQLLSFAKDSTQLNKEVTSLTKLIEESVGFYLSGSKSDYQLDFAENIFNVEIDRGQIYQVLNNIIINADQAMVNGGTITVKTENITLDQNQNLPIPAGHYVRISISDEGIGISPQHLQKIFDPYFTTRTDGNGLGLSTAYSIVKKHGGHITVASKINSGSTFSIFLPASSLIQQNNSIHAPQGTSGQGKILVLDDNEIIRKSADRLLSHLGYKVFLASEGSQVIEYFKHAKNIDSPFDAAILDLTIPGGKGAKDIIEELLEINPLGKIIVSSGYTNDPVITNYKSFKFSNAISKPYDIETLSKLLKETIDQSKRYDTSPTL